MISSEIGHTHTKSLIGGVNGRSNCKDMATINITVFCNKVAMTKIKLGSSCFSSCPSLYKRALFIGEISLPVSSLSISEFSLPVSSLSTSELSLSLPVSSLSISELSAAVSSLENQ